MQLWWICIFVVLAIAGCGTQDYGEPTKAEKPQEVAPVVSYDWEAAVSQAKDDEPRLVRGRSSKDALLASDLAESEDCPDESVCVENAYLGPQQFKALAAMSSLFKIEQTDQSLKLRYNGTGTLRFAGELIDLPPGTLIKSCAEETILNLRVIQGSGHIDTSGDQCERQDGRGGALLLAAPIIQKISINSDGASGRNGEPLDLTTVAPVAADGKSEASWAFSWGEGLQGEMCVTESACEWDKAQFPRKQAEDNLALIERSRLINMKKLKESIKHGWDYCRAAYCWIMENEEPDDGKHLFLNWLASLDTSALHGQDSQYCLDGNDGSDGGAAGEIVVISESVNVASISSNGGSAGKGSKGFCQKPGKGAQLKNDSHTTHEIRAGFYLKCGKRDRNLADKPYIYVCSSSDIAARRGLSFRAGKDLESPKHDASIVGGDLINKDGKLFGRNGKPRSDFQNGIDGVEGDSAVPARRTVKTLEQYAEVLTEECPDCLLPESIEIEIASENPDS